MIRMYNGEGECGESLKVENDPQCLRLSFSDNICILCVRGCSTFRPNEIWPKIGGRGKWARSFF